MAGNRPEERVAWPLFRQDWRQTTFLHWRYGRDDLRPLLPAALEPDIVDGSAWVSITPFRVERFRLLAAPAVPGLSSFPETNVRTYVRTRHGRDGLWFLSLDVGSTGNAVAGRIAGAPYFRSAMSVRSSDTVRYRSRRLVGPRAEHDIVVRPGPPVPPGDEVARLLAGRWRAFSCMGSRLIEAPVEHEPWPLRSARVERLEETLIAAAGLPPPRSEPLVHFAEAVDARFGSPARVET